MIKKMKLKLKILYKKYFDRMPMFLDRLIHRVLLIMNPDKFREKTIVIKKPLPIVIDSIEVLPFKFGAKAAFCMSIDLELNWSYRIGKHSSYDLAKLDRKFFDHSLQMFEKYSIPVTWAVVGHLFLKSCKRIENKPHPDMPRPNFFENESAKYSEGDWYQHDPCTQYKIDPLWYAPDLISKIIRSDVKHEVGCHTFSHVDFSDEFCTSSLADEEIKKCMEVMSKYNIIPRSFIFPYNREGNFKVLFDNGIITYGGIKGKGVSVLQYPTKKDEMLWNIMRNRSLGINFLRRGKEDCYRTAKRLISEAVRTKTVIHFWCHPYELSNKGWKILEPIIANISIQEKKGELWLATMGEIACYCEARKKVSFKTINEGNTKRIFVSNSIDHSTYGYPDISIKIPLPKNNSIMKVYIDDKPVRLHTKECIENNNSLILTFSTAISKVAVVFSYPIKASDPKL